MKRFLYFIMMAMVPLVFAACDGGDDYYGPPGWHPGGGGDDGGALNKYEENLVGSYVSDDDPANPFYLVLRDDRTGYFESVSGGQTTGDDFTWWASESTLSVVYESDGARADMAYYYRDNHLYVDGIPLVVNDGSAPGGGEATPLIGQWEGRISGYYSTVFGLADDSCFTTCEFASNGDGVQLDYNIHRPKTDYAYTPFTWSLADGVIVLNYVENDNEWLKRAIINDYALSATRFSGTVAYGQRWFGFVFTATEGFDWSPYIGGATRAAASSRMRMARQVRCAPVRSGAFAR